MPELPEVAAICRLLKPRVRGRVIRCAQVLRARTVLPLTSRQFCQRLRGAQIVRLERRGKNLIFRLARSVRLGEDSVLLTHLRMSGNLYLDSTRRAVPSSSSLVFHLVDGERLILEDRRGLGVCQLLTASEATARLSLLGPESLSPRFTARKLWQLTRSCSSPIKTFLMDQRRVAGLGNIYAAEALFRAGIHPRLRAAALSPRRARKLHLAIVEVLEDAVKSARRGYRRAGIFASEEAFAPQVYRREGRPCRVCGREIRRLVMGSRSTFYCPRCQRM